jgi:predicted MFS family arabinose efflux permease
VSVLPPPTVPVFVPAPPLTVEPVGAAPRRRRVPVTSVLLVVAVALAFADASVVALALPQMYADFDTSIVGVSWVLTTYALTVAVVAIPVALLHRVMRPARTTAIGLLVFAGASLAAGLAPALPVLLAARAVQGIGATLLLAGSEPVLARGLRSAHRGRVWWAGAAAIGAVAGPALGGVLTQLLDWRAIFLVQAPIAALAVVACLTPRARAVLPDPVVSGGAEARDRRGRRVIANIGLVLVFAGLVGALFLGVLLAIEVWRYTPIEGAVLVTALPVGMFLARPLRRCRRTARGVGGALILAGGLLGLAMLPGAAPWAAAVAFGLCGAGFGLVSDVLGADAAPPEGQPVRDSTIAIGARHAGLVVGLVLIAPVLSASIDTGIQHATLGATRSLLEAQVPLSDKVPVTWDLRSAIEATPKGQVPDMAGVFDKHGAGSNAALAAARDDLMSTITDTITRSFRPAFAAAAVLAALSAIPVLALRRRRRSSEALDPAPARGSGARGAFALGVVGLLVVGLIGGELRAGAPTVGDYHAADPCTAGPDPYPGSGLDAVGQRIALSALNGAACDLHTTRERLVLSMDPNSGYHDVTWDKPTMEKALKSGTDRAIKDAQARGTLPGWAAAALRFVADHAPIGWILNRLPF